MILFKEKTRQFGHLVNDFVEAASHYNEKIYIKMISKLPYYPYLDFLRKSQEKLDKTLKPYRHISK